MNNSAKNWINRLKLKPHPEGGYYRRTYASTEKILHQEKRQAISSAIFYLLLGNDFSAFHQIKSDEIWHYYDGNSDVKIYSFNDQNQLHNVQLGTHSECSQPQHVVQKNNWFAAELSFKSEHCYALVGCTLAPAFDFSNYTLANRDQLTEEYPKYKELIQRLTR